MVIQYQVDYKFKKCKERTKESVNVMAIRLFMLTDKMKVYFYCQLISATSVYGDRAIMGKELRFFVCFLLLDFFHLAK